MDKKPKVCRGQVCRMAVVAGLAAVGAGVAMYLHLVVQTDVLHAHFAYLPVILACLWWGRKGLLLAAFLVLILLASHLVGIGPSGIGADVARAVLILVVAVCVAELSEKVMAAQKALRVSEERHRLLVEKSLAGIFIYRDERILFANAVLGQMLGYTNGELVGKSIWDLFYEDDRPKVQELVLKRKTEGLSDLHYECRLVRKSGEVVWADVASSVSSYESRPAVLVNAYNITEKKEAEQTRLELSDLARKQQEQLIHSTRLAELGEMAAGVAHELNQPLTGIRNFARNAFYMLDQSVGTTDDVKSNLRLISEQVDRASKIINQMRELTRKSEQHFAPLDLNALLRESVEFLMPQLKLAGVEVTLDLAKHLPKVVGDRIRLEQVFLNLIANAKQAMEETTERRLSVISRFEWNNGHSAVVTIADTGRGFGPDVASKLFRPFFSTKQAGQGTGLGLSISLSIIKDHKGTIEAEGAPGKGAKFIVRLPIPQETQHEVATWDD